MPVAAGGVDAEDRHLSGRPHAEAFDLFAARHSMAGSGGLELGRRDLRVFLNTVFPLTRLRPQNGCAYLVAITPY